MSVKVKRYLATLHLLEVSFDELNHSECRAVQTVYLQFPFKCQVADVAAPGCTTEPNALQDIAFDMCKQVEKIWTHAIERMKAHLHTTGGFAVLDAETEAVQLAVAAWQRADRKSEWKTQKLPDATKRRIEL